MALASGWKPGMTNQEAASLDRPNEHVGYRHGKAMLLDLSSEEEVIGCMERARAKAASKRESKLG